MRALGIDFGEQRIGLAISDPTGRFALPRGIVERDTDRRAIHRIASMVRSEAIELLVIGEPRMLDGEIGPAVERVRRFADKLQRVTRCAIEWVDESLTTVEASQRLREAGLERGGARSKTDRRAVDARRDAVAAQILLQEALDRRASRRHDSPTATETDDTENAV